MRELDYMLDQFIMIRYQMVFGFRIQEYSNSVSDQNTYFFTLLSQTIICTGEWWKSVCGREGGVCGGVCICIVVIVIRAWVSADNVKLP